MIRLYHGSNVSIGQIDLSAGRRGKDFGQGFYLSADLPQAMRMAQVAVEREGFGRPVVTAYLFDETHLADGSVRFRQFDAYTAEWARFIVANRQNRTSVPTHDYDIVYGPIADDRVGVQVQRYMQRYIGVERLVEELKYLAPTFQYFFGTEKAIQLLRKI